MNKYRISGKTVESIKADIVKLERPGSWTIIREKNSDGVWIQKRITSFLKASTLCFQVDGYSFKAEKVERERKGGSNASAEDLKAQFPGKVRKVLAKAGQAVGAGEPLLLVEAMKMEFQVKAPSKGKVKAILVKEGQQLGPGDLMVDFEAEAKSEVDAK